MRTPRPMKVKSFIQCQGFNGRAGPENKLCSYSGPFKNYTMVPLSYLYLVNDRVGLNVTVLCFPLLTKSPKLEYIPKARDYLQWGR